MNSNLMDREFERMKSNGGIAVLVCREGSQVYAVTGVIEDYDNLCVKIRKNEGVEIINKSIVIKLKEKNGKN